MAPDGDQTEFLRAGSVWRRWDLHIHAPGTAFNDQFSGWDEYTRRVEEAGPPVSVLGITDYLGIDTYKQARMLKVEGRFSGVELLIPNIEFRISPHTRDGRAIHLHLLVSPDDPDHIRRIEQALTALSCVHDKQPYPCNEQGFRDLGAKHEGCDPASQQALTAGRNQYKIDYSELREWWEDQKWLQENSLVAVDQSSDDGTSGLGRDSGYAATRREIERFSQFILSGSPAVREYFLGNGVDSRDEIIRSYGRLKPCIHGCDAHSDEEILNPALDRYCWIKADPTFEGLRQVMYEPEDRVYIGATPPGWHEADSVVQAIRISDSNGWFDDFTLPLNTGLITIIGNKGMGKTALADAIAYGAGGWVKEEESFLWKARHHIQGMGISLTWASGREEQVRFEKEPPDADQPQVRYLTQQFVERLCAGDGVGGDLLHEIEEVVFSYLDETDRLEASDFAELRDAKTQEIKKRRAALVGRVSELNRRIDEDIKRISTLGDKNKTIASAKADIEAVKKQFPDFQSEKEKERAEMLGKEKDARSAKVTLIAQQKSRKEEIGRICAEVAEFGEEMERFYTDLHPRLKAIGLTSEEIEAFRPAFKGDTASPLRRKEVETDGTISELIGDQNSPEDGTQLRSIEKRIKKLEDGLSEDQNKKQQLIQLQNRLTELQNSVQKLEKEVDDINNVIQPRVRGLRDERMNCYLGFFDMLKQEQAVLEELYVGLSDHLSGRSQHEKGLEFYIHRNVDISGWSARGEELLDIRTGPFRGRNSLLQYVEEKLLDAWRAGDKEAIQVAIESLRKTLGEAGAKSILRAEYSPVDLADWLFSLDHITLRYGIRYDGVELKNLSPGTKGIVLLILYLAMDRDDHRPLIVDQPDENLDNESVYEILSVYFREAKNRRQVILVTHNPNLVVGTDAEQVIIATKTNRDDTEGLPHITYHAGALEGASGRDNRPPAVRDEVCRILEGGRAAFAKREQKYGWPVQTGPGS